MKILITGASGFIGGHLAEYFSQRDHEVVAMIRRTSDKRLLESLPVKLVYSDVTDIASLEDALAGIDWVIHTAGLTRALNLREFEAVNSIGTQNLLEVCIKQNVKRVVHISSQAAAGASDTKDAVTEADPPKPISDYGKSKLLGEKIVETFMDNLPITIVRPPAVYGRRDTDNFPYFKIVNKGLLPVLGFDEKYFSFCYIDDLLDGIRLTLETADAVNQTYFICHKAYCSWDKFGKILSDELGKSVVKIVIPEFAMISLSYISESAITLFRRPFPFRKQKVEEMRQKYWVCSPDKAMRELGFQPSDMDTKIRETTQWYLENGWL